MDARSFEQESLGIVSEILRALKAKNQLRNSAQIGRAASIEEEIFKSSNFIFNKPETFPLWTDERVLATYRRKCRVLLDGMRKDFSPYWRRVENNKISAKSVFDKFCPPSVVASMAAHTETKNSAQLNHNQNAGASTTNGTNSLTRTTNSINGGRTHNSTTYSSSSSSQSQKHNANSTDPQNGSNGAGGYSRTSSIGARGNTSSVGTGRGDAGTEGRRGSDRARGTENYKYKKQRLNEDTNEELDNSIFDAVEESEESREIPPLKPRISIKFSLKPDNVEEAKEASAGTALGDIQNAKQSAAPKIISATPGEVKEVKVVNQTAWSTFAQPSKDSTSRSDTPSAKHNLSNRKGSSSSSSSSSSSNNSMKTSAGAGRSGVSHSDSVRESGAGHTNSSAKSGGSASRNGGGGGQRYSEDPFNSDIGTGKSRDSGSNLWSAMQESTKEQKDLARRLQEEERRRQEHIRRTNESENEKVRRMQEEAEERLKREREEKEKQELEKKKALQKKREEERRKREEAAQTVDMDEQGRLAEEFESWLHTGGDFDYE